MNEDILQLGDAKLDCGAQILWLRDGKVNLPAKTLQVLRLLAAHAGETVQRRAIIDAVWNGNHYVGHRGLTNVIWQLRQHLGANAIVTVVKTGYRLTLPVTAAAVAPARAMRFPWRRTASIAGVAIVLFAAWNHQSPASAPMYAVGTSLTYFSGVEEYPAYSRSGDLLAFTWEKDDSGARIMLRDLRDGGRPLRQVSLSADDEVSPAWGPDDAALAFARIAADGSCKVVIRRLETLGERAVDGCIHERYHRIVEWSADGRFLFYTGKASSGGAVAIMRHDLGDGEIRRMTRPGPGEEDNQLAAAPDGHRLAFVRTAGATASIHLLDENGNVSELLRGEPVFGLAWQDERHLVLNLLRHGEFNLWRLDTVTGDLHPLHQAETPFNIAVARDGSGRIAYSLHRGTEYLEVLDPATRAVKGTVTSTGRDLYGSQSVARGELAFLSTRSGRFEIWVSRPDGGAPRALTENNGLPDVPAWSPDGTRLVSTLLDDAGHSQAVLLDPASGGIQWLTAGEASHRNPGWIDAHHLLLASDRGGEWNLWRFNPGKGGWTQLTADGGQFGRIADGTLYYTRHEETGLWRRPLAGGVAERVLDDLNKDDWGSWDIGNGMLYYVKRQADFDEIWRVALDDGTRERIVRYPRSSVRIYRGLSLAPNGDLIVTRLGNREADIIELHPAGAPSR
ncbi:MAG TPA: winged helix-turn-helix domain-containing protein [Gammaproteobacteria bacterium]